MPFLVEEKLALRRPLEMAGSTSFLLVSCYVLLSLEDPAKLFVLETHTYKKSMRRATAGLPRGKTDGIYQSSCR